MTYTPIELPAPFADSLAAVTHPLLTEEENAAMRAQFSTSMKTEEATAQWCKASVYLIPTARVAVLIQGYSKILDVFAPDGFHESTSRHLADFANKKAMDPYGRAKEWGLFQTHGLGCLVRRDARFVQDGPEGPVYEASSAKNPETTIFFVDKEQGTESLFSLSGDSLSVYSYYAQGEETRFRLLADFLNRPDVMTKVAENGIDIFKDDRLEHFLVETPAGYAYWRDVATGICETDDYSLHALPDGSAMIDSKRNRNNIRFFGKGKTWQPDLKSDELMQVLRHIDPDGGRWDNHVIFGTNFHWHLPSSMDPDFPVFESGAWRPLRKTGSLVASDHVGPFYCEVRLLENPRGHEDRDTIGTIHTLVAKPTGDAAGKISPFTWMLVQSHDKKTSELVMDHDESEGVLPAVLAYLMTVAGCIEPVNPKYTGPEKDRPLHRLVVRRNTRASSGWAVRPLFKKATGKKGVYYSENGETAVHAGRFGLVNWIANRGTGKRIRPSILVGRNPDAFADLARVLGSWQRGLAKDCGGIVAANGLIMNEDGCVEQLVSSSLDDFAVKTVAGDFRLERNPSNGNQFCWSVVPAVTKKHHGELAVISFPDDAELAVKPTPGQIYLKKNGFAYIMPDKKHRAAFKEALKQVVIEVLEKTGRRLAEATRRKVGIATTDLPEPKLVQEVIPIKGSELSWVGQDGGWTLSRGIETIARFDTRNGRVTDIDLAFFDDVAKGVPALRKYLKAA